MRWNRSRNDRRALVALATLVVFAFVLLAALLAPSAVPPELALLLLAALIRLVQEIVGAQRK